MLRYPDTPSKLAQEAPQVSGGIRVAGHPPTGVCDPSQGQDGASGGGGWSPTRIAPLTNHARDRLIERFPHLVADSLIHEVRLAVGNGEYEVLTPVRGWRDLARIEFSNVTVYVLLGADTPNGRAIVSAMAPDMVAFTPWGKIRLPKGDRNL